MKYSLKIEEYKYSEDSFRGINEVRTLCFRTKREAERKRKSLQGSHWYNEKNAEKSPAKSYRVVIADYFVRGSFVRVS